MTSDTSLPPEVDRALAHHLLKRLPMTFQPFFRQQLRNWHNLFPYERQYLLRTLTYLGSLNEAEFSILFRNMRKIEDRMSLGRTEFSTRTQTMEDASILERSPYYQEWRQEVQRVFHHIDRHAQSLEVEQSTQLANRLIMLILPARLPIEPTAAWQNWTKTGREVSLNLERVDGPEAILPMLFGISQAKSGSKPRLIDAISKRSHKDFSDVWVLDAGTRLWELVRSIDDGQGVPSATSLSWVRLKALRERLLEQIDKIEHNLTDADAVFTRLHKIDISDLCPAELAARPILREFTRDLLLSGNGALLMGSAFVEWGASMVFRRARPSILVGRFGIRNKPKPFTSVAVFENQDKLSPLPDIPDLEGSALDAQILMRYVWLASARYSEYKSRTVFMCLAENVSRAVLIAPPSFHFEPENEPARVEQLGVALANWLA